MILILHYVLSFSFDLNLGIHKRIRITLHIHEIVRFTKGTWTCHLLFASFYNHTNHLLYLTQLNLIIQQE